MLETICISSLMLSINICSGIESEQSVLKTIESKIAPDKIYLTQGRPYESDYERDAERERERRDIWNHGESQSDREEDPDKYRHRYDEDNYRREVENDRIYRDPDGRSDRDDDNDADDYRREAESERIYRDLDRYESEDYRREVENDWIYRQRDR